VAVGAMGIGTVVALFQYFKAKPPPQKQKEQESQQESQQEQQQQEQLPEIKVEPDVSYICINTADLDEITQLLTTFNKRFHVIQRKP